jgi:phosphatidylglycerophosphate synthase
MDENTRDTPSIAYDQRLARLVARTLARTPITPNMVTSAGLAGGLLVGWLFARGDAAAANWAGGVFMFAAWVDHLDGELARASGKTSKFGHHYDNVAMLTTYVALFVGMGFGVAARGMGGVAVALGIAAGVAVAVIFGLRMWIENRFGSAAIKMTPHAGFEIEDTLYVVGPVAWLGVVDEFLVAAGIGAPLFLIWVVWDTARTARSP